MERKSVTIVHHIIIFVKNEKEPRLGLFFNDLNSKAVSWRLPTLAPKDYHWHYGA